MSKETADRRLSLRVTDDAMKRATRIKAKADKDPRALGRVTISSVLKRAMDVGLEVLEREYEKVK